MSGKKGVAEAGDQGAAPSRKAQNQRADAQRNRAKILAATPAALSAGAGGIWVAEPEARAAIFEFLAGEG